MLFSSQCQKSRLSSNLERRALPPWCPEDSVTGKASMGLKDVHKSRIGHSWLTLVLLTMCVDGILSNKLKGEKTLKSF